MEENGDHYSDQIIRDFIRRDHQKLASVNDKFLKLFQHKDEDGKPSLPRIIIEVLGAPDAGKTVFVSRICELAHEAYGSRVAFWNMPDILQEELGKQKIDYFYNVTNMDQVKPESILNFDEGAIDLDAKLALTKKHRGIGQWMNIIRHKHCMIIMNSQIPLGIIKGARARYNVLVLKKMHTGIDLEPEDLPKLVRENGYYLSVLRNLEQTEALIVSTHKLLSLENSIGIIKGIRLPSWWNPRISEMWANRTIDTRTQNIALGKTIAAEALNLGYKANSKYEAARLRCWLYENYEIPSEVVTHVINKVLASQEPSRKAEKPAEEGNEKYTDEGFEANILQTLPEFLELWDPTQSGLLSRLRAIFGEEQVTEGEGYVIPPRQTKEGDPTGYPDVLGVLKGGSIGDMNAKYWNWRTGDVLRTHSKMKSEILWYTRLQDKGFTEPIKVILFAKHKTTGQAFIFTVPIEKALHGSYPIQLPAVTK